MTTDQKKASDSAPLWEGFEQSEVRIPFCDECGRAHLPPGPVCPFCLSEELEWRATSGKGKLATWVIERRKWFPEFDPPYAVGHVELAEGPRMVVSLSMDDLEAFSIDAPGEIEFYRTAAGKPLPRFRVTKS